jgi:hypothetical protein
MHAPSERHDYREFIRIEWPEEILLHRRQERDRRDVPISDIDDLDDGSLHNKLNMIGQDNA